MNEDILKDKVVKIDEYMRPSDGARIIVHKDVATNESEYFGTYSVDTGFGLIDRTFKFEGENHSGLNDCFADFHSKFEEDAVILRDQIEEEKAKQSIVTPDNNLNIL